MNDREENRPGGERLPRPAGPEGPAGEPEGQTDFVREIIRHDLRTGKHDGRVQTRFPPEPNGYLHIGHAKAVCLNFGVAAEFGGKCNLRYDDTNPTKEEVEYVDAIKEDIRWLGFDWQDREFYASDYYQRLYDHAVELVRKGLAYVDSLTAEQIGQYRGVPTSPGQESPYRNRPVAENLDLLERMRAGEFPDGSHVLRAKIDMASPNMNMRDPTMYRIRHQAHHRTGNAWCIYPMYDWAHGLCDSYEMVTHSLCSLEFENHRPLYDWFLEQLGVYRPQQIEFARLNLTYTVLSKRRLLQLVQEKHVSGWDDPRMPTLSGYRRLGYTPSAIRSFCDRIGLAKRDSIVDIQLLEHVLREELNKTAPRVMAVLEPLRLVIEDYPEGKVEQLEAVNNPEDAAAGTRLIPFSRELWVERDDFREDPPRKWFRLAPGREVRLKHAYYVTVREVVKDARGEVVELRCTHDPASRGGGTSDGRKVQGTLQWVSAAHAVEAEVRLYDHLFTKTNPMDESDGVGFLQAIDPESLVVRRGCKVEPSLASPDPQARYQFLRQGYFCADSRDSRPGAPVFNRTVGLKDSWARMEAKPGS